MSNAISKDLRADLWKQAEVLSKSQLVPERWRGKPGDIFIMAVQARELGIEPVAATRLTYVVRGEPALKAEAVIGLVNRYAGMASEIMFEERGELMSNDYAVRAYAISAKTGERLYGIWVGMDMVIAEKWGESKKWGWPHNPKYDTPFRAQMLRYKSAAFWARLYAPQVTMGMMIDQEIEDMPDEPREVHAETPVKRALDALLPGAEEPAEAELAYDVDEDTKIMRGDYDDLPFGNEPSGVLFDNGEKAEDPA